MFARGPPQSGVWLLWPSGRGCVFLPVSPPLQLGPHLSTCICLPKFDGAGVKGERTMLVGLLDIRRMKVSLV